MGCSDRIFREVDGEHVEGTWRPVFVRNGDPYHLTDRLAGRHDSTERCLAAADAYRRDQTEANRAALRAANRAIPEHVRMYALGDMDGKDGPLRALAFDERQRARIAEAENPHQAKRLAEASPRPDARLAVMAALLREKFRRHPGIAAALPADDPPHH